MVRVKNEIKKGEWFAKSGRGTWGWIKSLFSTPSLQKERDAEDREDREEREERDMLEVIRGNQERVREQTEQSK